MIVFLATLAKVHVAFLNCYLGPHIHAAGWDDWGKSMLMILLSFMSFKIWSWCEIHQRVNFSKELSPEEAVFYKKKKY